MTRPSQTLLASLLAVLAMLLALTGSASAAFNDAATEPHYGNFLLWESETSGGLPPEPLAFSRERIDYSYDIASGVPVFVRQNPWSKFDPNGLFAQEIDAAVTGFAGWIDEKTNNYVTKLSRSIPNAALSALETVATDIINLPSNVTTTAKNLREISKNKVEIIISSGWDTGKEAAVEVKDSTIEAGEALADGDPDAVAGVLLMAVTKKVPVLKRKRNKFNGKQDTVSTTDRAAFRNAKDQNGIPRSQQPDKSYTVPDKHTGKPLKQYDFTNSDGKKISIRRDNPVNYKDKGSQGEHYNAGTTGTKLKQHHNIENEE